jgi:phenylalanyl-tRNA synthetase beta chain
MKIAVSWLKDHIKFEESAEEIGKKLTASGLEVEGIECIESIKGGLKGVVVGEVKTCVKHPDADKLSITTVDLGSEELVQIVCGAPNVAAGQKVLVATVGTTLYPTPDENFTIKKAKIRGVESIGMICAEDELGLGKSHDGIMVLDANAKIGTAASDFLNIQSEEVIEIGLTPNRIDAASHFGVARDIQALTGNKLIKIDTQEIEKKGDSPFKLEVSNAEACPRYCGLYIQNVKVQESPEWLKSRLKSIGINPKNNLVDITNYILHDLGQPMHVFDADKIAGGKVNIRLAKENEKLQTLDEVERKLGNEDLVIADGNGKVLCLAGVMGGMESAVTLETKNIFLESAYFSADYVRKSSLNHGLKSDSSYRFERGIDPNTAKIGIQKAFQFIQEMAGGEALGGVQEFYPKKIENFVFDINLDRVLGLIGVEIPTEKVKAILDSLEIKILSEINKNWTIEVPSYRVDVQREADISEELLRIYGFDQVPISKDLSAKFLASNNNGEDESIHTIAEMLASNGFYEIITNSLTKPHYAEWIDGLGNENSVYILNKLSEEHEVMRQSMLFSGLEVLARNFNRKVTNQKIYEFGKTYHKIDGKYIEKKVLSLFLTGNSKEESWIEKEAKVQFNNLAQAVLSILEKSSLKLKNQTKTEKTIFSAGLDFNLKKGKIASLGAVKAQLLEKMDIDQVVFYAEIDLELLISQQNKNLVAEELSKYPEVRRDLSLVIDKNVTFEEIRKATQSIGSQLIKSTNVFDVYVGENLEQGKKSYSVSYILSDTENTLKDEVIDGLMNKLIQLYEKQLGAVIRR